MLQPFHLAAAALLGLAACTGSSAPADPPSAADPPSIDDPAPSTTASASATAVVEPVDGWSCGVTDDAHRWGLHCSDAELVVWRDRAHEGPYRTDGDVSANSPGDWERIRRHADAFFADPGAGRWSGPPGAAEGCVQQGDEAPPTEEASALRDAAFAALIEGDREAAALVRDELRWFAEQPGLDLSRRDRWCPGVLYDVNPGFEVANWLTKLLYAYDYLGPDVLSRQDVAVLDRWFGGAATFLQLDLDASFQRLFVDRDRRPYELVDRVRDDPCDDLNYLGGPPNCGLHQSYNNRKAAIARFVALVGQHQRRPELVAAGERFVEELLIFGVFPEGAMGEFERWSEELPDLGWAYATQTLGAAITIADAAARAGDDRLFRFSTEDGAMGTEGGPKSLATTIAALGGYLDGTYDRYVGPEAAERGDPRWRIDGIDETSGWYSIHDVILTPADRYLDDSYLRGLYTRSGPGLPPYPAEPAGQGPHIPWTGDQGTFPGVLMMFGVVDAPYPGSAPTP